MNDGSYFGVNYLLFIEMRRGEVSAPRDDVQFNIP